MIKVYNIPFDKVPFFSKRDKNYTCQPELFKDSISELPDLEGLKKQVLKKAHHQIDRSMLVNRLELQFSKLESNPISQAQIIKLKDNKTFTICTAHQPVLFGGPSYVIYKAISAIKLAGIMKEHMPDYEFVPVFVLGDEDHDFEEINHTTVNDQLIEWPETKGKGSVGHYPTSEIIPILKEMKSLLPKNEPGEQWWDKLHTVYTKHFSFGLATQELLHGLLSEQGMLVIRLDDPKFKESFIPSMVEEVEARVSESLINKTLETLKEAGYKPQAKPRPVNLFYRNENGRHRVRIGDDQYFFDDSGISLTKQELVEKVKSEPSSFSPNVIMRPLFQESILPNIAYVGGGGEIAYWTERKTQFEHFGVPLPVFVRRDSAFIILGKAAQLFEELKLDVLECFLRIEDLIKIKLDEKIDHELHLRDYRNEIISKIDQILETTSFKDQGIIRSMESEKTKILKSLNNIESKIRKGYSQNNIDFINKLREVHNHLFPGHKGVQERVNNISEIYTLTDENLISRLLETLNPLDRKVTVMLISDEE
jgi:bacillithiol biosynthesis cysteine-adding enzyme BshC